MAAGTDEDGAYAARMDEWVAWETAEGAARVNLRLLCLLFLIPFFCNGGSYPEACAMPRVKDSIN
jgi:hypothetical protein